MEWLLITWFVGAGTPEQYGYKPFATREECRAEMDTILNDLATQKFEPGKVAMKCVERQGRDPQMLAYGVSLEMKSR